VLKLENISKTYQKGSQTIAALQDIHISVENSEYIAITGSSGSGKSTLLNLLGLLDTPSSGRYRIYGHDASNLDDTAASRLRNQLIGFVFQSFHLIPERRAWQNVALPLEYLKPGLSLKDRKKRSFEALERVGLLERAEHFSSELSGGQEQRVAIARALVNQPKLILADEPTGNLDATTGLGILELLEGFVRDGATLLIVTHDLGVAARATRVIELRDGQILNQNLD
jgi:putative ABC transport system ATP-binding protein